MLVKTKHNLITKQGGEKMDKVSSKKLKSAMLAAGIGTLELAQSANVQPATVSKFLKGDSPARLPTISKICKALSISPNEILKGAN